MEGKCCAWGGEQAQVEGKPAEGERAECKVGQRATGDSNAGAGQQAGAEAGQRESAKQRARKPGRGYQGQAGGEGEGVHRGGGLSGLMPEGSWAGRLDAWRDGRPAEQQASLVGEQEHTGWVEQAARARASRAEGKRGGVQVGSGRHWRGMLG